MVPTTATPWSSSENAHDARMAVTTTTSAPGTLWAHRLRASSTPSDTAATTIVSPCASPRLDAISRSCSSVSFDETGMPNSFPSWPTIRTTATPWR